MDKVIKQFDEQIVMSPAKSFLLFRQSLQGCQTAIDKMTRRTDLRIDDNAVLRKYLRGLAVVGHKPPAECDSMDTEYRDLYRDYSKYQESADPQHMFIIRSFLRRTRFMLTFLRFALDGVFLARGPRLHPRTELQ